LPLSWAVIWRTFKEASWGLMSAVNYAILVSLLVYRDLTLGDVYRLLIRSAMTTSSSCW